MDFDDTIKRKIVSSDHLATEEGWPLSEMEFSLNVIYNAFSKWTVRCASAAGFVDMNHLDVMVIHHINHRDTAKRRADICFMLNIEDTHTVNYTLKKLAKQGLVEGKKRGKEIFYSTTEEGKSVCQEYRNIRELCLISTFNSLDKNSEELSEIAEILRGLSGIYDQASRAAASL
jgi:predicted MarR family transcription regulator